MPCFSVARRDDHRVGFGDHDTLFGPTRRRVRSFMLLIGRCLVIHFTTLVQNVGLSDNFAVYALARFLPSGRYLRIEYFSLLCPAANDRRERPISKSWDVCHMRSTRRWNVFAYNNIAIV